MASGVARGRNRQQIIFKRNRILTCQLPLDASKRAAYVVAMHNPLGIEMAGPLFVIRNVIPVREEHQSYATKLFDAPDQRAGESGRVDQHVPFRSDDQITGGA